MSEKPTPNFQEKRLEDTIRSLEKLRTRDFAPRDIQNLMELELDRAQLSYALGITEPGEIKNYLGLSAGAAQACGLIVQRAVDPEIGGDVFLTEPERDQRSVPIANLSFSLEEWIGGWSAAMLARDMTTLQLLCTAEVIADCTPPPDVMDPVWTSHCGMLAAATVAPQHLQVWIEQTKSALETATISPHMRAGRLEPVLALAKAFSERQSAAFLEALVIAVKAHKAFWVAEDLAHHARASWPLEASAMAILALDSSLIVLEDLKDFPPELPVSLFPPRPQAALSLTAVIWPLRSALSADEANWFLDLRGIPRTGREHSLIMRQDQLVAEYHFNAALVPQGTASFALVDDLNESEITPALDAGELLFLAEKLAGSPPPDAPQTGEMDAYRLIVQDSIAAMDAALGRIPDGSDRVPESSLVSSTARAIRSNEPGRFRQDRMEAYRNGISRALDRIKSGPKISDADAKTVAMTAADAIKTAVSPLLEALAGDDGSQVAGRLTPQPVDFAAAFTAEVCAEAELGYHKAWSSFPEVDPPGEWRELQVEAAAAGLLLTSNALSDKFPGAYKLVSDKLVPHNVWIVWRYVTEADGSGDSYDGLVWVNGRWVWFPKPWRYFNRPSLH